MYAVVKTGGRQYRVAVGDVLDVGRLQGQRGDSVSLSPVLVVDGTDVTMSADDLAGIEVTGEVVGHGRGPKIRILKYKNKTGYRKRQGHRQDLTRLKVTGIGSQTMESLRATRQAARDASGTDTATPDTDKTDTATAEAKTADAATPDTATADTATADTATTDGKTADAATTDAGSGAADEPTASATESSAATDGTLAAEDATPAAEPGSAADGDTDDNTDETPE